MAKASSAASSFEPSAAHVFLAAMDMDLEVGAHAVARLPVAPALRLDEAGHERALRLFARLEEPSRDEQRVETHFFRVVGHAELIQISRSFARDVRHRAPYPHQRDACEQPHAEDRARGDRRRHAALRPEGLGLDSIDALELAVGLEKNFGVPTPNAEVAREAFHSVRTIAEFVSRGAK